MLSGFLITSILLDEHRRTGSIHIGNFYIRRGLRLLPALVAMVIGVAIFTFITEPTKLAATLADARSILFYYFNWRLSIDAAALGEHNTHLIHLWSLSVGSSST